MVGEPLNATLYHVGFVLHFKRAAAKQELSYLLLRGGVGLFLRGLFYLTVVSQLDPESNS